MQKKTLFPNETYKQINSIFCDPVPDYYFITRNTQYTTPNCKNFASFIEM